MSYQVITDFRQGLDARKFKLALPPGTLLQCDNAHITPGGEIEKRKAFVPVTVPAAYTGIHFGLQPASDGIYIFGSTIVVQATATRDRNANVARLKLPFAAGTFQVGDVVNISGVGGVGYNGNNITLTAVSDAAGDEWISYASVAGNEALNTVDAGGAVILSSNVLPTPLVYQNLPNPNTFGSVLNWTFGPALTDVVSSSVFSGAPFALARYADGTVYPFYGAAVNVEVGPITANQFPMAKAGTIVPDSISGIQIAANNSNGQDVLQELMQFVNATGSYTATTTAASFTQDIFSIPTTLNGTPYTATVSIVSPAGTLTVAQQTNGTASTDATQAVGSFQIVAADIGTQATGTIINSAGANMNDGDTVTIGTTVYRFKNAPAQAYDVKIGADRYKSAASFAAAINGYGTAGTDYFAGTLKHTTVQVYGIQASGAGNTVIYLAAIAGGTAGNALALSSTAGARSTVSGATLTGAVDSKINQIVVNGATNLLAAAVTFTTNEAATAAAVGAAINGFPASGYQAQVSGSTITILKQTAGATANGFPIQVQAQGTIVCSTGAFTLTGSGFTVDFCKVSGVDLMNDTILPSSETVMTYPQAPALEAGATAFAQVLSDFCRAVANNINSGTSSHGYLAYCSQGAVSLFVSKATTTSSDAQAVLDVSVTPTAGNTGSAIPTTITPLSVTIDTNAVAIGVGGKSSAVTATPIGGVAPFNYSWAQVGSNAIGTKANTPRAAQTTFSSTSVTPSLQFLFKVYSKLNASEQAAFLAKHKNLQAYLDATAINQVTFVCTVTDALGEQAVSDQVYITLLALQ